MSDFLGPHGLQHARLCCPSLSPGVCSNSCPLSRWCYPTISSSIAPFSSYPQSFSASGTWSENICLILDVWSFWDLLYGPVYGQFLDKSFCVLDKNVHLSVVIFSVLTESSSINLCSNILCVFNCFTTYWEKYVISFCTIVGLFYLTL